MPTSERGGEGDEGVYERRAKTLKVSQTQDRMIRLVGANQQKSFSDMVKIRVTHCMGDSGASRQTEGEDRVQYILLERRGLPGPPCCPQNGPGRHPPAAAKRISPRVSPAEGLILPLTTNRGPARKSACMDVHGASRERERSRHFPHIFSGIQRLSRLPRPCLGEARAMDWAGGGLRPPPRGRGVGTSVTYVYVRIAVANGNCAQATGEYHACVAG